MPDNGVPANGVPDSYALDPAMPVLLRPDGTVQVGWDPLRAVVVRPPDGLSASRLAALLKALPLRPAGVRRLAAHHGLHDDAAVDHLLDGLLAAGVLRRCASRSTGRTLAIRVHGCGPLADLLTEGLRCSGARVSVTSHTAPGAAGGADVVVLTDRLAADPRLLRELHTARVPHLPVRLRDGTGLVGPLVVPGVTSCLTCTDLHRTDRDPAWPAVAAQLREVTGCADRPTALATAALALSQLHRIITAVRDTDTTAAAPESFDTSWEVDMGNQSITARRWPRHPLCGCWRPHG